MSEYSMPVLSEQERKDLIGLARIEVKRWEIADGKQYMVELMNIALAALTAPPRGYLTWHAIPPTWSDPGGGGEYLAFHESKPEHGNDDGTEGWPVFDFPPVPVKQEGEQRD